MHITLALALGAQKPKLKYHHIIAQIRSITRGSGRRTVSRVNISVGLRFDVRLYQHGVVCVKAAHSIRVNV